MASENINDVTEGPQMDDNLEENIEIFNKKCDAILDDVEHLKTLQTSDKESVKICNKLFNQFNELGTFKKNNKIPDYYPCAFTVESEQSISVVNPKIVYFLMLFISQLGEVRYGKSSESDSYEKFATRSGIAFFFDFYRHANMDYIDDKIIKTWNALEAQLDYIMVRWAVKFSFRPLKVTDGINTNSHWWWKFVDGTIPESSFNLLDNKHLLNVVEENKAPEVKKMIEKGTQIKQMQKEDAQFVFTGPAIIIQGENWLPKVQTILEEISKKDSPETLIENIQTGNSFAHSNNGVKYAKAC